MTQGDNKHQHQASMFSLTANKFEIVYFFDASYASTAAKIWLKIKKKQRGLQMLKHYLGNL